MAIKRVKIKDFLVFKGEFATDFCPGVNVFIGGNSTGKTTLLRCLYDNGFVTISTKRTGGPFSYAGVNMYDHHSRSPAAKSYPPRNEPGEHIQQNRDVVITVGDKITGYKYIPEKDILEHAKGLLPFIEQKQTGFNEIYKDVLVNAQDIPTKNQNITQIKIGEKIADIIGGYIEWVQSEGMFYTIRTDGMRIPFIHEASGFKKLGFLGLLVSSGQLEPSSVLFWDEPENSLNPELIPVLVDILLELSRSGVQIFLATHSELLASYIDESRQNGDEIMFASLYKKDGVIKINTGDRFDLLTPNKLTEVPVMLYEKKLDRGLGGE